ncbi:MAG: hypothetical protein HAW66_04000 [Shewanella sp.]|nr:hypothetical protein [Shewanella sp.]
MFELGLEIAMPITFLSMTVLLLKDNATFAAVAAAGVLAFYTTGLPYQLGLCLSSVVGITVGFYLDKRNQSKKGQTT